MLHQKIHWRSLSGETIGDAWGNRVVPGLNQGQFKTRYEPNSHPHFKNNIQISVIILTIYLIIKLNKNNNNFLSPEVTLVDILYMTSMDLKNLIYT